MLTNDIFKITESQSKNIAYNTNKNLLQGFIDCVRLGQQRMALEYLAFIMENLSLALNENDEAEPLATTNKSLTAAKRVKPAVTVEES